MFTCKNLYVNIIKFMFESTDLSAVTNCILKFLIFYAKLRFGSVLKRSSFCTLNAEKVIFLSLLI